MQELKKKNLVCDVPQALWLVCVITCIITTLKHYQFPFLASSHDDTSVTLIQYFHFFIMNYEGKLKYRKDNVKRAR